ncbi:MAG TPA: helicase-related protein [Wenzhouxiangella sp.]|nr:helicase-related protein [Wenzhouxiangella sp.]
MLDPNQRSLLTDALTPPAGMSFDCGLATTYSLHPDTLLTLPLHLAVLASDHDAGALRDPIPLLDSLRRVASRLAVFHEAGRISAPAGPNRLYSLLESTLHACRAPHDGAFHPKVMLLRFVDSDTSAAGGNSKNEHSRPALLRLLVMSRNLTADRSWDLSVRLDGEAGDSPDQRNTPIVDLFNTARNSATKPLDQQRGAHFERLMADASRCVWALPKGFDDYAFHLIGHSRQPWQLPTSDRLAIISPFISDTAVRQAHASTGKLALILGLPEELNALRPATRKLASALWVLAEAAQSSDEGEDNATEPDGLHAKSYLLETGNKTRLMIGSANATSPVFAPGSKRRNVEFMVELTGPKNRVGGISQLMGSRGLADVCEVFQPVEHAPDDEAAAIEQQLETARQALRNADMQLRCEPIDDEWRMRLDGNVSPAALDGIAIRAWPLSLGPRQSVNVEVHDGSLQDNLMRLMCRTERIGLTARHDAMLTEERLEADLETGDLKQLQALGSIGDILDTGSVVEYWKSSPYLLNFMKDYKIKTRFDSALGTRPEIRKAVKQHRNAFLPTHKIRSLQAIDPGNLKLRPLIAEIEQQQLWRLLWMPPSLPYWQPAGEYKNIGSISKQLIFSSWNVVPDAIAAMTSYAVDRLMLRARDGLPYQNVSTLPRLLTYSRGEDGAPQIMSAFALFFPSPELAALLDPATLEHPGGRPALSSGEARSVAQSLLGPCTDKLPIAPSREVTDLGWFSQFIARLTAQGSAGIQDWCRRGMQLQSVDDKDAKVGLKAHQTAFAQQMRSEGLLPSPPDDFETILANMVLGGPGICALRALHRAAPRLSWTDPDLLSAAATVANGLRSLFNAPEVTAMLQHDQTRQLPYWQRVLKYCVDGNLQAVLDEHVHILGESLGMGGYSDGERVARIASEIRDALSLRTTRVRADGIGGRQNTDINMRCHYAVRFGDAVDSDAKHNRKELVRTAFNSPFRPFILASTSVGQEGLDFHPWCHSVIHWNLPSNPVDLEQREGRVHRYKGYAVRKNVARYAGRRLNESLRPFGDLWTTLFDCAARQFGPAETGLRPYWVFETADGDKVTRRLINPPLSIDIQRYAQLQSNLALYRMAFGQPRQEDIIRYLETQFSPEDAERISRAWRISLSPGEIRVRKDSSKQTPA